VVSAECALRAIPPYFFVAAILRRVRQSRLMAEE
jgi:hypothetical protein